MLVVLCAVCVSIGGLRAEGFVRPSIDVRSLRGSYDVVIAGAGTGGVGAAIQAARLGATVYCRAAAGVHRASGRDG